MKEIWTLYVAPSSERTDPNTQEEFYEGEHES
jgi:hypothetical protein